VNEAAVQEMIAEACLGLLSDEELARDLRAFLERHALDPEDIEAICASPPRLGVYRRLVRTGLVGVTTKMMPRTRARLNALAKGAFDASFAEFLATTGPRSHFLREVPGEFLAWALPRWQARADVPRYASDLAAHEIVEFDVAAAPLPPKALPLDELALDRPLVFHPAKRLMPYSFAVHALAEDPGDMSEPEERPVHVLVFRDAEHGVRSLELSSLHAAVLEALFGGAPLGAAVAEACACSGAAPTEEVLASTAKVLAMLAEHGLLMGAAVP
jgi:hypothetical protein